MASSMLMVEGTGAATLQGKRRGVEIGDGARGAAAAADAGPEAFAPDAVRRDDTDAADDYPWNRARHGHAA
jgi:hypothetical protein